MRAQNLRLPGCALALFALGAAAAPSARQELFPGTEVEGILAGGETHSYAITAELGTRWLVTVEQRGVDVVVEVAQADGESLLAVDSPNDSEGPESVLIPAAVVGPLEVKVRSPSAGVAPGREGDSGPWRQSHFPAKPPTPNRTGPRSHPPPASTPPAKQPATRYSKCTAFF